MFVSGDDDFVSFFQGDGPAGQVYAFTDVFGDRQFAAFATHDLTQLFLKTPVVHRIGRIFG